MAIYDDDEVVELLSSDDEDEVKEPPKKQAAPVATETINLCDSDNDDDDDDDAKLHHQKPAAATITLKKRPQQSTNGNCTRDWKQYYDDEEDEDLRRALALSLSEAKNSSSSKKKPPLTNAAHYLEKAKLASSARRRVATREQDQDSDDDDDALFNFDSGMGHIRKSSMAAASKAQQSVASSTSPNRNSVGSSSNYALSSSETRSNAVHEKNSGNHRGLTSNSSAVKNPYASAKKAAAPTASNNYSNNNNNNRRKSAPPPLDIRKQQRTKTAQRKSAPAPASKPKDDSDDDDDDDDDDLFNFDTGIRVKRPKNTNSNQQPEQRQPASLNPYRRSTSFSAASRNTADPFPYPKLTETSKQYPDLRVNFLLAFWKYGRSLVQHSYDRSKLDRVAQRVVKLAVATDFPVRSVEEMVVRGSSGSVAELGKRREAMRSELERGGFTGGETVVPPETAPNYTKTKYFSIAEACLVVLLEHAEFLVARRGGSGNTGNSVEDLLSEKQCWLSLINMIPTIDSKLRRECPGRLTRRNDADWGARHYQQGSTNSIEFMQIKKLECVAGRNEELGPFIKRRSVKKECYYELLPDGYHAAMRIRTRQFPAPPGHYRSSKIHSVQDVDPRYPNICLGVDLREGGGGAKKLHHMCYSLEQQRCPYFVGSLSIGDYVFFTKKNLGDNRMDYLCPILVERKSIQDVAQSIYDGRWTNQKIRMYQAQYVFGYDNCRMVYIIEGNINKQLVNGGHVGARWFNVDEDRLNRELEDLKDEGFEILRTTSVENSMFELARWVRRVAKEVADGTLKPQYTYAEFKTTVGKIPKQTNFSYMAKDHVRQKKEALQALDEDSDIEVLSDSGHHGVASAPQAAATLTSGKKRSAGAGAATASRRNSSGWKTPETSSKKNSASKKRKRDAEVEDEGEFFGWTNEALKSECGHFGLPKTGSRADLVKRLRGPKPPAVWLERKRRNEWIPARADTGGTALLVALHLYEQTAGPDDSGITKDELYAKAESLDITKNPFSGGTTQTGPYLYTGWSNMEQCRKGDLPLVVKRKNRFKLTTNGPLSGVPVANAIHEWCHELGTCPCEDPDFVG